MKTLVLFLIALMLCGFTMKAQFDLQTFKTKSLVNYDFSNPSSLPVNATCSSSTYCTLLGGTYDIGDFIIPIGVTVKINGSLPLIISARNVVINGILEANGTDGYLEDPIIRGGFGFAGGGSGGDCYWTNGFGTAGQDGFGTIGTGGGAGIPIEDGGSGGGGGNAGSGGGGGGGRGNETSNRSGGTGGNGGKSSTGLIGGAGGIGLFGNMPSNHGENGHGYNGSDNGSGSGGVGGSPWGVIQGNGGQGGNGGSNEPNIETLLTGGGGGGSASSGGSGGGGGGIIKISAIETMTISGYITSNGGSGKGAVIGGIGYLFGGGGGGAGGTIFLAAPIINSEGCQIEAKGGGGGGGYYGGGGGGGAAGRIIVYNSGGTAQAGSFFPAIGFFGYYIGITLANIETKIGQSIEIPITTYSLQIADNIISYQFDFEYDASKMQYQSASVAGTIAAGGSVLVNSATAGHITVGYTTTTPLSGAGDIVKLQFTGLAEGTSPMTISNFRYNATSITNITNGTATILENIPPTAAITYSDANGNVRTGDVLTITATFSEAMADAPVPQIVLSGANTLSATDMTKVSNTVYTYTLMATNASGVVNITLTTGTDLAGNALVSAPTSGGTFTVLPFHYGDVDDDGSIYAYDAALALQYSVGLSPAPCPLPWETWRLLTANVDNVAGISANDASLILQKAIGIITSFPVGKKGGMTGNADVNVSIESGNLVFKSTGELFGLNVFVKENMNLFGVPQFLNANMLSATNISTSNYAIGLATARAQTAGEIFMKIPFSASQSTVITFDMIVNTSAKQVSICLTTGIVEISDKAIFVYPNPANNILFVNGLTEKAKISIYDLNGKMIINKQLTNNQIDISSFQNGIFTIKIETKKGLVIKKFVKQ